MTLTSQLSVRFNSRQRDYLKSQLQALQALPGMGHIRCSEADMVRALVNEAMQANRQIVSVPEADE